MRRRRCQICSAPLYEDERSCYCQDCEVIVGLISEGGRKYDRWPRKLPAELYQARQERIRAHQETIARELARMGQGG
jgi:hypothetical protein